MTTIEYKTNNNEFTITLLGHAGYAEKGSDIVCSAISALIQTLVAHMDDVADSYEDDVQEGYVYLHAKGYEACMAFRTVMTGLRLLEENYPDYVTISAL